MYHHGPSVWRINISTIHQYGGLKRFRQGSPNPLEPFTPQREASFIYWLFQHPDLKHTYWTKHFDSLYV